MITLVCFVCFVYVRIFGVVLCCWWYFWFCVFLLLVVLVVYLCVILCNVPNPHRASTVTLTNFRNKRTEFPLKLDHIQAYSLTKQTYKSYNTIYIFIFQSLNGHTLESQINRSHTRSTQPSIHQMNIKTLQVQLTNDIDLTDESAHKAIQSDSNEMQYITLLI